MKETEKFSGEEKEIRKSKEESAKKTNVISALKNGSAATRISAVFMGAGQIFRGQIVKGALYLAMETAFVLFMIFFGGGYVAKLFSDRNSVV